MSGILSNYIWLAVFLLLLSCKSDYKRVDSPRIPVENIDFGFSIDHNPVYLDSLQIEETYYSVPLEKWPEFPGGNDALQLFLKTHLHHSKDNACVNGVVYVTFQIRKDGRITEIAIAKGQHEACNTEAMRVVALMPHWKPGEQSGKPVTVLYTLPIRFSL